MDYLKVYTKTFACFQYSNVGEKDPKNLYINEYIETNKNIQNVVDIGTGRGFLVKGIKEKFPELELLSVDLKQFNDIDVDFMRIDLSSIEDRTKLKNFKRYDLLTCLDVLEHLDKSFIEDVLVTISKISKVSILTIANHSDIWNGVELHTIREDFSYWEPLLLKYFTIDYYEEKYLRDGKPRLYLIRAKSK